MTLVSATSLTFSLETLSGGAPCRMPDSLSSWCAGCVDRHSSHFAHIVPSWSLGSTVQIMLFLRKFQVCPGRVLVPQVWGEEGRRALASLASLLGSANCLLTECRKSGSDGGRKIIHPPGPHQPPAPQRTWKEASSIPFAACQPCQGTVGQWRYNHVIQQAPSHFASVTYRLHANLSPQSPSHEPPAQPFSIASLLKLPPSLSGSL